MKILSTGAEVVQTSTDYRVEYAGYVVFRSSSNQLCVAVALDKPLLNSLIKQWTLRAA